MKKLSAKTLMVFISSLILFVAATITFFLMMPSVIGVHVDHYVDVPKGSSYQIDVDYDFDKEDVKDSFKEYAISKYHVEYASASPETATVDTSGHVKAKDTGTSQITVSSNNTKFAGITDSCWVHVYQQVRDMKMPGNLHLIKNKSGNTNAKAIVFPVDASDYKVKYSSSDESVARVAQDGSIEYVGNGTCEIKAELSSEFIDSRIEAITELKIDTIPEEIKAGGDKTLYIGGSYEIPVSFAPEDSTLCGYTVTSSDESIVSVSGNTVKAKKAGTATITVQSTDTDLSAQIKIVSKEKTKYEIASNGAMGNCGRISIPSVGYSARLNSPLTQSNCDAADSAAFDGCLVADHWNQGFSAMKASVPGSTHAYIRTADGSVKDYICTANFKGTNTGTALVDSAGNNVMHGAALVMYTCNGADWTNVTITFWSRVS